MGIQGLLPFVHKSCRTVNLAEFAGCSVAIDGHCWLHRAICACAEKLIRGESTTQYVAFCMKYLNLLKKHRITPIIVFDGNSLPSKNATRASRREKKRLARAQGEAKEREGKYNEARQFYVQSLDITAEMIQDVIQACKDAEVDYLVAPFEADAQLTYLINRGIVHFIVTEDSDLIAFGCKRILFKLDLAGNGLLYERHLLYKCLSPRASLLISPDPSSSSNDEMLFTRFRYACIMSGCDYYPGGFSGVGLLKACKAMMNCSNISPLDRMLNRLPQYLRSYHMTIREDDKRQFIKANQTFLHQIVFDPLSRQLVPLSPLPEELQNADLSFAGHGILSDVEALQMAIGHLLVAYPNSQDDDQDNASTAESIVSPLATPQPSQSKLRTSVLSKKVRKDGIWSQNFSLPKPLKSPARSPIKRRATTGQIVTVDVSAFSQSQKTPSSSRENSQAENHPEPGCSSSSQELSQFVQFAPSPSKEQRFTQLTQFRELKLKRKAESIDLSNEDGDGDGDDVPPPKTPVKKSFSWSADPKLKKSFPSFTQNFPLMSAGKNARKLTAHAELRSQIQIIRSSYFGGGATETITESVPETSAAEVTTSSTSDYGSLNNLSADIDTPDRVATPEKETSSVDRVEVDDEIMVVFESPPSSRTSRRVDHEAVQASSQEPSSSSMSSSSRLPSHTFKPSSIPKTKKSTSSLSSASGKIDFSKYAFKKATK